MRQLRAVVCITSLLLLSGAAKGQEDVIHTIAGGGPNYIYATNANVNGPGGVALDSFGNYYISSANQERVFKVTLATGILTVVAGNGLQGFTGDGGPATQARLNLNPYYYSHTGVAVDLSGDVYIADTGNCVVREVNHSTGTITAFAGMLQSCGYSGDGGPATQAQLSQPTGVAVDATGNVYIADTNSCVIREVSNGTILTVAGTGVCGYYGDGGPATDARLAGPSDVAVSPGRLYIADTGNYRIRRVTLSTGIIDTVAGNGTEGYSGDKGPATSAEINSVYGIAADYKGNVFIADYQNVRIREVTASTGGIDTVAGNGIYGYSGDGGPATNAALSPALGVGVDSFDHLFIADTNNNRIREVILGGNINTVAGNGLTTFCGNNALATSAVLNSPQSAALDSVGNIYIADTSNNVVREVHASTGLITTLVGTPGTPTALLYNPRKVAVDSAGNTYIADSGTCLIVKVDSSGKKSAFAGTAGSCGYSGDKGPATAAQLSGPSGVAVDGLGNVYIADTNNCVIREVVASTITSFAGTGRTCGYFGDGGPAAVAQLSQPSDVAVDAAGNLYIADTQNLRIRRVDPSGTIDTIAGNGFSGYSGDGFPAIEASLNYPSGVAVDAAGADVLIADTYNNRIRWVDGEGIIRTVAGNGGYGYSGDGEFATSGSLTNPYGVGVDSKGNIYIADTNNNRIRKVNAVAGLSALPSDLTFEIQLLATTSNPQVTTLAAFGPLSITSIATSGDFSETDDCGSGLPSGTTCTAWVYFTPTAAGNRTGKLTITDNGFFSKVLTVNLKGVGTALTVTPPEFLTFGNVAHGTSVTKNVVLKNNSSTIGVIMGVISHAGDASFSIASNTCTGTLGASKSCTIGIKFAPTSTGAKTGELIITDNDPTSPQLVGLTGTGT